MKISKVAISLRGRASPSAGAKKAWMNNPQWPCTRDPTLVKAASQMRHHEVREKLHEIFFATEWGNVSSKISISAFS